MRTLIKESIKIDEEKILKKSNDFQSTFDVGDYKDPEIKISDEFSNKYYIDENGIISSINPICPHCNSRKVVQWNLYSKNIISEQYCGEITIQRYYCKRCKKNFYYRFKRPIRPIFQYIHQFKRESLGNQRIKLEFS